jgi:hypothetical protein
VGVDRETVIDCVRQNKCDDLSAMYHMIKHNYREVQREKSSAYLSGATSSHSSSSLPPLSPTSLSPFFPNATTKPPNVTEIFNEGTLLTPGDDGSHLTADRLLNLRRHTLGPGQTPVFSGPAFPPSLDYRGILPQTNLMQNLPLVSNLPPENFSIKDPHLLKPPPALLGVSPIGRRASDGGGYFVPHENVPGCEEAVHAQQATTPIDSWPGPPAVPDYLLIPQPANYLEPTAYDTCSEGGGVSRAESPNHHMVEQYLRSRGQMKRHTIPESPRKRRTGLHTVMEKPPDINPELVQEVETRIRSQSPNLIQVPPAGPLQQMPSPPKQSGCLRTRRTGLSTVMEVGKLGDAPGRDSLHPPSDRYSPVRRLTEAFPSYNNRNNSISSTDASPSSTDVRMLQEEVMRLQDETQSSGGSVESASSGYMSPHFYLRPPSPGEHFVAGDMNQPRRASDCGVRTANQEGHSMLKPSASTQSATSEPLQQLIDEMYNPDLMSPSPYVSSSRRYSYPNSPVHVATDKHNQSSGISSHLQHLKLHQKSLGTPNLAVLTNIVVESNENAATTEAPSAKWKGSITQGVPSRTMVIDSNIPAELLQSLTTPHIIAHSHSFDETLGKQRRIPSAGSLSALSLWRHQSVSMYDTNNEDCMSLPYTPLGENYLRPEICVTNVAGDDILVYGSCEPMDQSS